MTISTYTSSHQHLQLIFCDTNCLFFQKEKSFLSVVFNRTNNLSYYAILPSETSEQKAQSVIFKCA